MQNTLTLQADDYRALAGFRYQIRRFVHFSEEAARRAGVEPQQHQMMLAVRALESEEGPTVRDLAEYLLIRHNSAVELLDRLEKRGLAFRERLLEDRRQARVRLSPGGCEILERLTADHREELGSLAPHLIEALNRALTIGTEENNSAEEGNVPASPHRRK